MSRMSTQAKPLAVITQEAIHLLCREIGVVNTLRFVNQFTLGDGNYTEEREQLFGDMTLDDTPSEIRRRRGQAPPGD